MKNRIAGTALAITLALPGVCAAGGFKAMAKELSRTAREAGIQRVAILPFVPVDGGGAKDGWSISEKLMTQVVRVGKVQAVERSLLRELLGEHRLAQAGVVDPRTIKAIGKVYSVEAIVTGSFATVGGKAAVNARLVHVETGAILAAVERRVDRDWLDAPGEQPASLWVPVPELTVEAPPLPSLDLSQLRDAPSEEACAGASERVDRMESQILELKTRYWAGQLRQGASLAGLKSNPGSTISDPFLKRKFYDRMKYWYGLDSVPELTPAETLLFAAVDRKAYSLHRDCGVF